MMIISANLKASAIKLYKNQTYISTLSYALTYKDELTLIPPREWFCHSCGRANVVCDFSLPFPSRVGIDLYSSYQLTFAFLTYDAKTGIPPYNLSSCLSVSSWTSTGKHIKLLLSGEKGEMRIIACRHWL